jgi:hypothetical protein
MSLKIVPETVLVDHLRNKVADPRNRSISGSQSFTATAGQTIFQLNVPTGQELVCVPLVEKDAVALVKWSDYVIDYQKKRVVLNVPAADGDVIDVDFFYGKNWIYQGKPSLSTNSLADNDFPRIGVLILGGGGVVLGQQGSDEEDVFSVSAEVYVKEDYFVDIGGYKFDEQRLAMYLAYRVKEALRTGTEEMYPYLYGYEPMDVPKQLPFDEELHVFKANFDFAIRGINTGE